MSLPRPPADPRRRLRRLRGEIKQVTDEGRWPWPHSPTPFARGNPTDVKLQVGGDPRKLGEPRAPRGSQGARSRWDDRPACDGEAAGSLPGPLADRGDAAAPGRPGDGQPDLAAPLRQADRGDPLGLRPPRRFRPPIPSCSTGWRPTSSPAGGRSRRCIAGSCSRRPINSPPRTTPPMRRSTRGTPRTGGSTADHSTPKLCATACSPWAGISSATGRGLQPFPAVNTWTFTAHHQFKAIYPSEHRSVYLMVQRLHPHPYLVPLQRS